MTYLYQPLPGKLWASARAAPAVDAEDGARCMSADVSVKFTAYQATSLGVPGGPAGSAPVSGEWPSPHGSPGRCSPGSVPCLGFPATDATLMPRGANSLAHKQVNERAQIANDEALEHLGRDHSERRRMEEAPVVDQGVDAAEGRHRLGDDLLVRAPLRDVHRHRMMDGPSPRSRCKLLGVFPS